MEKISQKQTVHLNKREREIAMGDQYVSGGEEELEFTNATPSRKETTQHEEMSLGDTDSVRMAGAVSGKRPAQTGTAKQD